MHVELYLQMITPTLSALGFFLIAKDGVEEPTIAAMQGLYYSRAISQEEIAEATTAVSLMWGLP